MGLRRGAKLIPKAGMGTVPVPVLIKKAGTGTVPMPALGYRLVIECTQRNIQG